MLLFLFLRYKFLNCKENLHNYLPALANTADPDTINNDHNIAGTSKQSFNNGGRTGNGRGVTIFVDGNNDSGNEIECDDTMDVTMLGTSGGGSCSSRQYRSRRRRQHVERPCSCLIPLIRFWGIITAIVICGVGVDITAHRYKAGMLILLASVVIFVLEVKWVVTLFIRLCTNNDYSSACYQCWTCTAFFGGWRLAPPYIAFGIALIMWPHRLWLCYVAGFQLIILALLRFLTIFRYRFTADDGYGDEDLLPHLDSTYDKCDSLTEILDDSMPGPGQTLEDENTMVDPNNM